MYKSAMILIIMGLLVNNNFMNVRQSQESIESRNVVENYDIDEIFTNEIVGVEGNKQSVVSETSESDILAAYNEVIQRDLEGDQIIPHNTKVNKVVKLDNDVLIDFSKELLNYGGNTWEYYLVSLLLETGFQFEDVNSLTISIDGNVQNLVEGSSINMYTRDKWIERNIMDE